MSLSTRAIAGIAGVVVVGGAALGTGIYWASDAGKPRESVATLVVGTSSTTAAPTCYNDGKPIDQAAINACVESATAAGKNNKLPMLDVRASDQVGVGVPKDLAKKGWFAFAEGAGDQQSQGNVPIVNNARGTTFSGTVAGHTIMSSTDKTSLTVAVRDPETRDVYAIWFFELKNQTD
ncbi:MULTISPECIES: hypothetical protein [Kitasatospora]|uniref:DUF2771 domain-containing protein n=1 Tax=Kitasatospora setae (strain ATCC 33774 / DSM 43861 / JCM 3304 / KCC A-0304 / NBRC 14216 / KM-6054) TaxID=452652 RepID=E4NFD8_KITSK|nr:MULTISPECIES: hypothetical protein [Kitasatospora]BAJ30218.1 hypothetical protein KSE_44350 [Kitasatospora setae KM-6054]